ncbi:MAG: 2-iminoacetate synthase ThiH [Acidimicrobiales bacterium]
MTSLATASTPIAVTLEQRPEGVPPNSAASDLLNTDLSMLRSIAERATNNDVDRALRSSRRNLTDFSALISPVAAVRLEELASAANQLTVQRFGRTIRLFAPLYLSSECVSTCTYCGFSAENDITRRTLTPEEARAEAEELVKRGFRHLLLVAGEHARIVNRDYLVACVEAIAPVVDQLSIEVQVWDTETYRRLLKAGCDGLVVYQETYNRTTYNTVHLKGKKRNYDWRLAAPDRGGEAGMRRLGVGALLGLHDDWRTEALSLAAHATALTKRWWRSEVNIALPRLRPAAGDFEPADPVSDAQLAQLLCALRLTLPDAGITLSTREPAELRDALLPLGVTTFSAGSSTEPGGYTTPDTNEPQFEVSDHRSPAEIAAALRTAGYDPIWKDWQRS